MAPKRKQESETGSRSSKRLRPSQNIPTPVEPPTKHDTPASRRARLSSSSKRITKASSLPDAFVTNDEPQAVSSDLASKRNENEGSPRKARVTRVYGKAGKQKSKTRDENTHDPEPQPPTQGNPPVRRQSRCGTTKAPHTVADIPTTKESTKKLTELDSSMSTDLPPKTPIPVVELPSRRSTRRTTAVIDEEANIAERDSTLESVPKLSFKRKTSLSIAKSNTATDAVLPKIPQRRSTRRTCTSTVTDLQPPEPIPGIGPTDTATRTNSSEPLERVIAAGNSIRKEPPNSKDEVVQPFGIELVDDDPSFTNPHSSPIAVSVENLHSARTEHTPEPVVAPIPQFNEDSAILPVHLYSCFHVQKRTIMKNLQAPICENIEPALDDSANNIAFKQLSELVEGSVGRAEGNSCLLLGPRGSGKTAMLERCLDNLPKKPVIIRLSGWVQSTDRHAIREIAIQLLQQTGSTLLSEIEGPKDLSTDINRDDDNPFFDDHDETIDDSGYSTLSLPPASHLHSLIPALLTLKRSVIVILDAFDLFALHPRQSLLYCLLDTVQNCRASSESQGIAVIGVTSRLDTIQLLEKRVKSRFSGRTIRTAPPNSLENWLSYLRISLKPSAPGYASGVQAEWNRLWGSHVDEFLADEDVREVLRETYSLTREAKSINRILAQSVLHLNLRQPFLSLKHLLHSIESQRSRPPNFHVDGLSYPAICLLIASVHLNTNGQNTCTFEMLFEIFQDQVRASQSIPLQVNGGSIGMMSCTRDIAMSAFESLISAKFFIHMSGPSVSTSKEFMKYRCALDKGIIGKLVEQSGQTNLKKWHGRAK